MAITFRKNASRDALYALAVENGVAVAEDADRPAIIAALEAANAAQNGADGVQDTGDTTDSGGAQNGAGSATDDRDGGSGTEDPTPAENATAGAQDGDAGLFAYVGPSLPNGRLKENAIFNGTLADVKKYLADVLEEVPQVAKLIVPADKLATFSARVKTPGNIAHKHYNDIVSAMNKHKEV